ncbi:hypothetical protein BFS14_01720 [Serratia fonticola]|uniref:hypothetical protein n=1 Tax=Serratia fonticola TaxID=47917 RepID=UPI0008FD7390|nr:hypothetical protein [Serratia fonticola]OIX96207.1 hypothetical protein BFS14_01720 [Serratia fonticola]QCR60870.1 hypothetical protein FD644_11055 [Serratia fonticola]
MADIYYPHDYLPMPQQGGYAFQAVNPLISTELVSGRRRQRRRFTSTPTDAQVAWFMETDAQGQVFEAWFRDALTDGASWFYMRLQTPIGVKFYKCRFRGAIYEGPTLVPPGYWRYSATLELWERPLPPPGWGNFPQFLAGQNIIDVALNREWPDA